MSSADQWRWTDDEGVQRLLRGDELRAALADGRLKPSTLVWKRGMKNWIAASEVGELRDAIRDDGPGAITNQVAVGKRSMPTPSIPAPGILPGNMLDINALRAAGVRGPVNTLVGVGGLDDDPRAGVQPSVRIPGAPKVPAVDGGWRDGAARADRSEDTVTALVHEEDGATLSEHQQPKTTLKKTASKKSVPPPFKRTRTTSIGGGSRKPPPPVRARPTAPLGGAAGLSRTLRPKPPAHKKPTNPSVPPPVGSSEVLSERFSAKHKDVSSTLVSADAERQRVVSEEARRVGEAPRKFGSLPPPRKPSFPALGDSPLGGLPVAAEPPRGADLPELPRPAELSRTAVPYPLVGDTSAAAEAKLPGPKGPMAKTGPLPELAQLDDLGPSHDGWEAKRRQPSEPAVAAQPVSPSVTQGAALIPTQIPPKPPMVAGLTVKYPLVAGAGAAALLALVLSFVFGRMSAPAKSGLAAVVQARTGWAVVPLFARTRAQTVQEPRPCLMLRAPSRFAPNATPRIPIEVAASEDARIAVGYAQSSTAPRGVLVDPATGKAELTFQPEVPEDAGTLERITPLVAGDGVSFGVTQEGLEGMYRAVFVPAPNPFIVGFDAENVLKADGPGKPATRMWSLAEGVGKADALRVTAVPGVGFPLTYRQKSPRDPGFIYYAMLDAGGVVAHPALALAAPEGEVGKPYIASGNGEVSVVFAHKQKAEGARWELRWARGPSAESLKDAALVDIPAGGPGGDAGSPAITALSGGRWLLMWMEGSVGAWTIRAQTYDRKYRPLGEALRVSPETGNFGQGVVGVVGEKGVVVFLLETAGDYEVWGTVLQCQ